MATLVDKYFSQADFDAIEASVRKAEQQTSGEIVVHLASQSKQWQIERLIHSSLAAVIAMVAALFFTRENNWGLYYDTTQALLWGGIGFVAAYFGWGQFLKRAGRRQQIVWKRALQHFRQIPASRAQTAILIFLSLAEEQAAIVADKAIASKVPDDYWHRPQSIVAKAMKDGKHAEGIIQAIAMLGTELAAHFPRQSDDINEFPDRPKSAD
ncbi:MAG: hypothetical protein HRF51_01255 [bacterium]|jgi:putative membrane protein